ncbi:protein angel homolog 2 [Anoplophora glabripennis]|uniref:protein angel homolog 2 n=1 Tax=Anoplophora glabripennis TaxID=217634 RepID=UPI000C7794B5|nr:protein angel homolog 2 [Anoplophora glabripennis]
MSKESDIYNLGGIPSTSGSSPSNWDCSSVDNLNANNETRPVEYVPNLVLTHPIISLNSVATNFYNINFYHTSNYCYMGEYFQQSSNRHYCRTDKEHEIKNLEQRNGFTSKKQSSCWLLLLAIYFLLCISLSDAKENNCEEENNDQRLLSLRKWENVKNENQSNRPGFIFTVMCYNVLSQDLLSQHPYLYNNHNNVSLQWNVRWTNIFNEITKFKPDVLCLQEVQESHNKNYFSILETIGYSSIYKRRTGEKTDGCAIYYKTDLIQLVEHTSVEYFQPDISVLNRDNIGLIAKFSPKLHPTREFVIATTHLLYNPRRQDVRLAQVQLLLTEIERISYNAQSEGNYLPVILAGDLNSTPDSAVYEFITKGKLRYEDLSPRALKKGTSSFTGKLLVPAKLRITDNCQHADLLERRMKNEKLSRTKELSVIELFHSDKSNETQSNKKDVNTALHSTGTLTHNFSFKSVYSQGRPEINEGTTFQGEWVTVDYIFYSTKNYDVSIEGKFKLLSRYRLPTKEELLGINIPNSVVGSDHLSLMAKFKLEY